MSGMEKIRQQRAQIFVIAARHGAGQVRAFGSVVRNEDRPDSDIDFLVTMQPGRDLLDLVSMAQELETLLHQRTDVVSDALLSPYLKDQILQEAVAI